MIIDYEGRKYHYDQAAITIDEYREFKRKYKLTAVGFEDGVLEGDPDALTCMWWVMLRQNGEQGAVLGDHLQFDVIKLLTAYGEGLKAEAAAAVAPEPEPDPTLTAPPSPAPSPSPPAAPSPAPLPPGQEGAAIGS